MRELSRGLLVLKPVEDRVPAITSASSLKRRGRYEAFKCVEVTGLLSQIDMATRWMSV